jgi:hypothetical protein
MRFVTLIVALVSIGSAVGCAETRSNLRTSDSGVRAEPRRVSERDPVRAARLRVSRRPDALHTEQL